MTGESTIPISAVQLGEDEERLVLEVLRSGRLAQGPKVELFEQEFAAAHDVAHAVAVNNGTTALVAAIQALALQPGDEVITSPFSFVATLNAILEAGATARFADIGDDFCMDPGSAGALIGQRTKAIMPVHLYGLPADMMRFTALAETHGLAVIEDSAQAHGARIDGRSVGSFGLGCFSFYATKNITSGEGGIVTTSDESLADRLRLLRNQGMRGRYQYEIIGHNYRMSELQAAIAIPQLRRMGAQNESRRANAARLTAGLADIDGVITPRVPTGRAHVFHQYTLRITAAARLDRDGVGARLALDGVSTGTYYPRLMHDYDCYRGHPLVVIDDTPKATQIAREVLSLPVHPLLTGNDLDRIITAVRKALT
jgi:perosamine synthetase